MYLCFCFINLCKFEYEFKVISDCECLEGELCQEWNFTEDGANHIQEGIFATQFLIQLLFNHYNFS